MSSEKLLSEEKRKLYLKNLSPYTENEFKTFIDQSEEDLKKEKFKSSKILINEVKVWS